MKALPPRRLPALAVLATVCLFTAAFAVPHAGALIWLAFVPMLAVLPRLTERGAGAMGVAAGLALYAIGFWWFAGLFGAQAIVLWMLLAMFVAVFCSLTWSIPAGRPAWQRALLAGCYWTAVEYIRCEQWPLRFSWLSPGYALHDSRVGLWAASWIGVYGLSFAIVALAAGAAWSRKRGAWAGLLLAAAVCAIPAQRTAPSGEGKQRVVLVQSPSTSRVELLRVSDKALAGPRVSTLLVWPEYVFQFTEEETPDGYQLMRNAAKTRGVTIVYGGMRSHGAGQYSSAAFVVGPSGKPLGVYEKHNPLPFFQDGQPGSAYPVFHWKAAGVDIPFGVAICFDLSFQRNARRLAANGARFLVVPSMEPEDWPRQEQAEHAMVAPMRAAENGISVFRCSTPGPSQVVAPNGAVLRSQPARQWGGLVWNGAPPLGSGRRTPFNRAGWLIPYACQVIAVAAILVIAASARKRRRTP